MPRYAFTALILLVASLSTGCMHGRKQLFPHRSGSDCNTACDDEGQTIRVKAPPQKIVIEQPEQPVQPPPDSQEKAPAPKPEPSKPESAPARPKRDVPESAPARDNPELGPAAALAIANQSLALAGQINSFRRTTARTNSLGTVTPGSAGLGFGLKWIHIPIPCPRIFSIEESPSITIPLSEANLVPVGAQAGVGVGARQGLTREELAAIVEQEMAAQKKCPPPNGNGSGKAPADDEEKKKLEKKLAETEAKLERLTKTLNALDEKLGTPPLPEK
jgi:hypothetical protein